MPIHATFLVDHDHAVPLGWSIWSYGHHLSSSKCSFFLFFLKGYLRLRVVVVSGERAIYQLLIAWFKIFYINPIICTMMPSTNKTLSLLNWHETWGGVGVGGRFLISQLKNNTTMNEDDHQIVKLSLVDWENKSRGIK